MQCTRLTEIWKNCESIMNRRMLSKKTYQITTRAKLFSTYLIKLKSAIEIGSMFITITLTISWVKVIRIDSGNRHDNLVF